jgi:predicted nucleic acid-binding protein
MKYLLDTYAWIEFFKASAKGERVAKLLENKKNKIVVCDVVFAEIFGWAIREKTHTWTSHCFYQATFAYL